MQLKRLLSIGQKGVEALATLAVGPAGLGIGLATGVVGFALNAWNDREIKAFAVHMTGLLPNSSRLGYLLEALAIVLTLYRKNQILNAPPLSALPSIYQLYLYASATLNGRSAPDKIDYQVTLLVEKIVKFLQTQKGNPLPTVEQWLPLLLSSLEVTLGSDLSMQDIWSGAPVPLMGTFVGNSADDGIEGVNRQLLEFSQKLQQLESASSSSIDAKAVANQMKSQFDGMAQRLQRVEKSLPPTSSSGGGLSLAFATEPAFAGNVEVENKQLRDQLRDTTEALQQMLATVEQMQHQMNYHQERLGRPRAPANNPGACVLL